MLRVEGLGIAFPGFALENIDFRVGEGDYLVLLGGSGQGKTLLLEALAGLIPVRTGHIHLDGVEVTHTPPQHRGIGLVFQDQALFPHLSVYGNVAYGLRGGRRRRTEVQERVEVLAGELGIQDLLERNPATLSGGEAQRVALARALAVRPRCLLLDEPLASLDRHARANLRAVLRRLHRAGHTVIHVTHDYEEAVSLASRVGVIENGSVVQTGTPDEVFHHPKSEFVAHFVGIRNCFHGHLESKGAPARFVTKGHTFWVLTDSQPGPGCILFRSEDVTIARTRPQTSAMNTFLGTVIDITPAALGVEVLVDIGLEVAALITPDTVGAMKLQRGQKMWITVKATAARFMPS